MRNILETAAQRYGIQASQLKPASGGHFSHVYEFSIGDNAYILRITPPDAEIDLSAMQANLEWMAFLDKHGASVSSPVPSKGKNLIELIERDGRCYLVVVFGEELSTGQWTDELVEQLGTTVGKLHALAQVYVPSSASVERPTWDEIGNCFNPLNLLEAAQATIREKQEQVMNLVQMLPKDKDGYGLIHTDLHAANFFIDPETNTITIFDFDDSAYGWFVMDIALILLDMTVLHGGQEKDQFAAWFLHWFLKGYVSEKPVSDFWIEHLPHFLKLLEIGLYIEVYEHYNSQDHDSWIAKFMGSRKDRIESNVPFLEIDFQGMISKLSQDLSS